jgi:uncharacterized protein (TIGR00661 family)
MTPRRVLYGVVGCGLGHTTRSLAVLEHLCAAGHEPLVVSSGRALEVFRRHAYRCLPVTGMHFEYVDGEVDRSASLVSWLKQLPAALRDGASLVFGEVRRFRPDAVVTDFEVFSGVAGRLLGVPVVSVDHQHVVDRCRHPRAIRRQVKFFGLLRAACAVKTFGCERYVVSSFFFPEQPSPRTLLVGPILRPLVERARPTVGGHVLVYQTTPNAPELLSTLRGCDVRFVVYGLGRDEHHGNVTLRGFSEERFVEDLASSRAVISNGGFTTIGEAIALGKPVLSIPVRRQPEQALNAAWLEAIGAGMARDMLSVGAVSELLTRSFSHLADSRLHTGRHDACAAVDAALAAA